MDRVYVIQCENDKWYIGHTDRPGIERLLEHFSGKGSEWTKLHRPIYTICCIPGTKKDEDILTLLYMLHYGWDNVRGGSWCRTTYKNPPERFLDLLSQYSPNVLSVIDRYHGLLNTEFSIV